MASMLASVHSGSSVCNLSVDVEDVTYESRWARNNLTVNASTSAKASSSKTTFSIASLNASDVSTLCIWPLLWLNEPLLFPYRADPLAAERFFYRAFLKAFSAVSRDLRRRILRACLFSERVQNFVLSQPLRRWQPTHLSWVLPNIKSDST